MPRPLTLRITEIFASIQGEGLRTGEPTIFIRLTGCNLCCRFCDTRYAWKGGQEYPIPRVLEKVQRLRHSYPADWVCLTGGEPLHQEIDALVRDLRRLRLRVQVETNGTLFRPARFDWITLSPKPKDYFVRSELIPDVKEIKLVVTKDLALSTIQNLRKAFPGSIPILLQPQSNWEASFAHARHLLRQSLNAGLKGVRLSFQMQKVFGFR